MNPSNHTFPSEASTSSEPIELTMDAFRPIEAPLRLCMDSRDAMKKKYLPYAQQDPHNATRVTIKTPDGSYESSKIHIDEMAGEIIVEADGIRILLDNYNVVVHLDAENPTIYRNFRCDVVFTA